MFKEEDVLSYYVDHNNNIYQMIGWCDFPTAVLKNLATGQNEHIVYNCLNAESYCKLVKEQQFKGGE